MEWLSQSMLIEFSSWKSMKMSFKWNFLEWIEFSPKFWITVSQILNFIRDTASSVQTKCHQTIFIILFERQWFHFVCHIFFSSVRFLNSSSNHIWNEWVRYYILCIKSIFWSKTIDSHWIWIILKWRRIVFITYYFCWVEQFLQISCAYTRNVVRNFRFTNELETIWIRFKFTLNSLMPANVFLHFSSIFPARNERKNRQNLPVFSMVYSSFTHSVRKTTEDL